MSFNQSNYIPVTVPLSNFKRLNIYFKQFSYSNDMSINTNLYSALQKKGNIEQNQEVLDELPSKRTLQVISFQRELMEKEIKEWFRVAGKIRKVVMGKQNAVINNEKQKVYFGLIVYKNEKDLRMAFEPDLIQQNVNTLNKAVKARTDNDDEDYLIKLYEKYQRVKDQDLNQQQHIHNMEQDGFTLVTDPYGQIPIINDLKTTEDQKQSKTHQKQIKNHTNDFYRFQIKQSHILQQIENPSQVDLSIMDYKQLIQFQKQQLINQFNQDKLNLQQQKLKKQN